MFFWYYIEVKGNEIPNIVFMFLYNFKPIDVVLFCFGKILLMNEKLKLIKYPEIYYKIMFHVKRKIKKSDYKLI